MLDFPRLAAVGGMSLAVFGFSLYRAGENRFEAPFVLFSLLAFSRLAGETAAFAYGRTVGRIMPFIPNECLACLAFYFVFIGLIHFARVAYGARGVAGRTGANRLVAMAVPIALFDAAACFWAFSSDSGFLSGFRAAVPETALTAGMSALGALGMVLLGLSFLFPRRVAE